MIVIIEGLRSAWKLLSSTCISVGTATMAALTLAVPACSGHAADGAKVNFDHLRHLTEHITLDGDSADIVHVYANYPEYHWTEANDSGTEGVACVDDAARAAVVYLRSYELTGDRANLHSAKLLLRFVLTMQTPDGLFYNFLLPDHNINRNGKTSVASFGWWAARGLWSIALGYHSFRREDPQFAGRLQAAVIRSLPHVDSLLTRFGETESNDGLEIPQWLLYKSGADVTSELLTGLLIYREASGDTTLDHRIRMLCTGLMMMQDGENGVFPYGLHRSWETMWHMWGNSQSMVLARAGMLLHDSTMIRSAEREAEGLYAFLLTDGFLKDLDVAHPGRRSVFEQIAYGVRPMTLGLLQLYEATGKHDYLVMAGLAASWLSGNNVARERMYDPLTGRCFDGITDSTTINRNSGAESTIEALYTLVELHKYPEALRYYAAKRLESGDRNGTRYAFFEDREGRHVLLRRSSRHSPVAITEGAAADQHMKSLRGGGQ